MVIPDQIRGCGFGQVQFGDHLVIRQPTSQQPLDRIEPHLYKVATVAAAHQMVTVRQHDLARAVYRAAPSHAAR